MILGTLTIGLNAIGILQPPHPQYNGFSVKDVSHKLREMRVPQYCLNHHDYERRYYSPSNTTCEGIERPLEAKVEEVRQKLQGIELTVGNYR